MFKLMNKKIITILCSTFLLMVSGLMNTCIRYMAVILNFLSILKKAEVLVTRVSVVNQIHIHLKMELLSFA